MLRVNGCHKMRVFVRSREKLFNDFDRAAIARAFDRAASRYDEVAVLQREVGLRMVKRLDYVTLQPKTILDLGCGTGFFTRVLRKKYTKSTVFGVDLAQSMIQHAQKRTRWLSRTAFAVADAALLPFPDHTFDLIFANFVLQWCDDLDRVLVEIQRLLSPQGLLMFTTVGPDTLIELRQSFTAIEQPARIQTFLDMHDIGDALVRARCRDPVMDREMIRLHYDNPYDVLRDLKILGSRHVEKTRSGGLMTPRFLKRLLAAYETYRDRQGRIPASYEVIYGHAWGGAPPSVTEISIPLLQLKRSSER